MKKWSGMLLIIMLAVSITACGTKAQTTNDVGLKTTSQTEPAKNEASTSTVPTLDELITQAKASTYKLDSYAMEMEYTQNAVMEQGDVKQEEYVKETTVGEYIAEPAQEHRITKLDVSGEVATTEEYFKENVGVFTLSDGVWSHSKDSLDSLIQSASEDGDVPVLLERLASIGKDEITIEVDGDNYVLTANAKGDKVKDFTKAVMMADAQSPTEADIAQLDAMFQMVNEMEVKLKIEIHKEHLYLISSEINISLNLGEGGMKMVSSFDTVNKLSRHNEITQILIPQEALDSTK